MRQVAAAVASALVIASCSIIYNPDNIHVKDAPVFDAHPDAAINPQDISVHDVFPARIDEGQGDGGGRPVVLVVHGANFTPQAMVALSQTQVSGSNAPALMVDNGSAVVSSDGSYIVVPVIAAAGSGSSEGVTVPLTVTVTEPNAPIAMLGSATTWYGHNELTSASVSTGSAAQVFSKVDLGSSPPTIVATGGSGSALLIQSFSSISIGAITATGVSASGSGGGSGGPGGCAGANGGGSGACDSGGQPGDPGTGVALSAGGGGGGAGFATTGTTGLGGNGGGAGGKMISDTLLTSWSSSGSIAAGGGGGGASVTIGTSGPGGGGGGGGGFVELVAGGTLTVSGVVNVSGGPGGSDDGVGGGGGAGGMVIVAGATVSVAMAINANGGAGGDSSGASAGGGGSVGRVRWDAPTGAAPQTTMSAPVTRGASFVGSDQVLTSDSLQLVGAPNASFDYYATNSAGQQSTTQMTSFSGSGTAMIQPGLSPGWNHVCVYLVGGSPGSFQAERCIDVAYLP